MKMFGKIALISAISAIGLPAMACDMHGVNGMHWTPMGQWQNFSPKASTIDPAFFNDDADPAFLGDTSGSFNAAPPPPRIRPSFSGAADRASRAAKTRLRMMGQSTDVEQVEATDTDAERVETAVTETRSETDTQPIR